MPELVAVPNLPGVPAVAFAPGYDVRPTLLTADAPAALAAFLGSTPQWGLFRNGQSVIQADGIAAFDHRREWVVCDYPVEQGAFASFNKVNVPFDVRLVFMAGGSAANRTALLNSITAIASDLNFYDAVMPEKVWRNLNVTHYDFSRTSQRGVGLLLVALWCREIRQASASAPGSAGAGSSATAGADPSAAGNIGDTAAPSGASPVDGGTVQPRDATPAEISSVGTQDFTGGYNVSGFDVNAPDPTGGVGEAVFTDPRSGQVVDTVPGAAAPAPSTSSTISGLTPAGPDQFSSLQIGLVPGVS
jgi:hypothetical protein